MTLSAYLDTETTGLPDDEYARVIEVGLALYDLDTGELVDTWEHLVLPDVITPEGVEVMEAVAGISVSDLEHEGAEPDDLWDEIGAFLRDWTVPVRCWNEAFDQEMWRRTFCALDPKAAEQHDRIRWGGCVQEAFSARFHHYTTKRPDSWRAGFLSLRTAMKICVFQGHEVVWLGDRHRALPDAVVTGRVDYLFQRDLVAPAELPSTGGFDPIPSARFTTMPSTGTFDPRPNERFGAMPETGTFTPKQHHRLTSLGLSTGTFVPGTS